MNIDKLCYEIMKYFEGLKDAIHHALDVDAGFGSCGTNDMATLFRTKKL